MTYQRSPFFAPTFIGLTDNEHAWIGFARAIQRKTDMPVFSWSTLLDYAYSIVAHRDFYGDV